MTGIPDAVVEAAVQDWWPGVALVFSGTNLDALNLRLAFEAGFAAAEVPWREHLATELEAVAEGIETNDQEYESGLRWAFWEAARIVRGTR